MNILTGNTTAVISAVLFVLCNLAAKKSLDPGWEWSRFVVYALAMASYWMFRNAVRIHGLAVASGVIDSLLTVLTIILALILFREPVTFKQCCGLALLLAGLYMVH